MSSPATPTWMNRLTGVLGLFIGVFGALAILGVFFKIAKLPHWEILMAVGFIGEAAAFVVMGILALIGGFITKGPSKSAVEEAVAVPAARAAQAQLSPEAMAEASVAFRKAMQASAAQFRAEVDALLRNHLQGDMATAMQGLVHEVGHLTQELGALGGELQQTRGAVETMRGTLARTATGQLPDSAKRLGTGMSQLADGMSGAGQVVERLHADLQVMGRRFQAFNQVGPAAGNGKSSATDLAEGVSVISR